MTWEELAAFIAALPEEERKRPAFLIRKQRVREILLDRDAKKLTPGYLKPLSKIRLLYLEEPDRPPVKLGDWVIE